MAAPRILALAVVSTLAVIVVSTVASSTASTAFGAPPAGYRGASLFAHRNVDRAWEEVKQSHRPMLLFISMDNCKFCDKMEADTYSNPEIARGIDELFVTVKMKKEENPGLIKQLGVRAFPTTLLILPSGTLIAKIEGYANPKKFVTSIRPALAAHARAESRTAALPDAQASDR